MKHLKLKNVRTVHSRSDQDKPGTKRSRRWTSSNSWGSLIDRKTLMTRWRRLGTNINTQRPSQNMDFIPILCINKRNKVSKKAWKIKCNAACLNIIILSHFQADDEEKEGIYALCAISEIPVLQTTITTPPSLILGSLNI